MTVSLLSPPLILPRHQVVPDGDEARGRQAVALAREVGLELDPWQEWALVQMCRTTPDGLWAAPSVGLIVPRQNGKTVVLVARVLAGLFLWGERLIVFTAQELKTSLEAHRLLAELIESNRSLLYFGGARATIKYTNGKEEVELATGQRAKFIARSRTSGRGLSPDTVIFDEAFDLTDQGVDALVPAMSARPNPQSVYSSSAPLDDDRSEVLRRFCRRGRRASKRDRLAYMEWCGPDTAKVDDWDAIQQANPNLGHRLRRAAVEGEQIVMSAEGFLRERCGVWDDSDDVDGWQAIKRRPWFATQDPKTSPIEDSATAWAIDVSPDRAHTTFVGAAYSRHGGVHLEVVDMLPGTHGAVARAKQLYDAGAGPVVIGKGAPAASLIPELQAAGVEVREVATEEVAQACGDFLDAVTQQQVRHFDDRLDSAARNAVMRAYGDAWLWSRRNSGADITALYGATLARWVLLLPEVEAPAPFLFTIGGSS